MIRKITGSKNRSVNCHTDKYSTHKGRQFMEQKPVLMGERTGGHMEKIKIVFLLSVIILLGAGCGKKEAQVTEEQSVETETQESVTDNEGNSAKSEAEEAVTEKPEQTEEPKESAGAEDSKPEESGSGEKTVTESKAGQETPQESEKQTETPQPQTPQPQTPEPEQPAQAEPVSYSPERVVQLATEKTRAYGKIYIPDDLNQMLAEGTLTQEEYNACYPTDGAGYLEFYVATDLNEARDVSGTVKFNSEEDIAENIAGMYKALSQQYFYIEYHGTVMYGDKECYVFYCYRA